LTPEELVKKIISQLDCNTSTTKYLKGVNATVNINYNFNKYQKPSPQIVLNGKEKNLSWQTMIGYNYIEWEQQSNNGQTFTSFDPDKFINQKQENDANYGDIIEVAVPDLDVNLPAHYLESNWNSQLFPKEEKLKIIEEKINSDNNVHTFEALVSKNNSKQAIKYKLLIKGNNVYELSTLVAKNNENVDPFVEKTFNSIRLENKDSENIFENKMDLFLNDVLSKHDSIRYSALKSIEYLKIEKEDLPKLINFLEQQEERGNYFSKAMK
jgi:hypothetical protein